MNTLTLELIGEMGRVLDICMAEKARALVITGSGRAFCCGAHLVYSPTQFPIANRTSTCVITIWRISLLYMINSRQWPFRSSQRSTALRWRGCEMAISADSG